ncbi:MAG TPA: AI-2E family transporter [Chloroflexia bacterium]|nr:AI-2E family transporter [Chloroflexia bacterium]
MSSEHIDTGSGRREPLIPPLRVTPRERNRLILVGIAALVVWWLLSQSLDAMGPFILALILGYLMLPLVDRLSKFLPRAVAILAVYLVFILIFSLLIAWLVPLAINQIREVIGNSEQYAKQVREWGQGIAAWYSSLPLSEEVRNSIEDGARNSLGSVGGFLQDALLGFLRWLTRAFGSIVGFIIIPFWLFYVLKDKDRGIKAFNNMLPRTWRIDVWRIVRIINGILSSYIRGQLILGIVVGIASTIGLLLVGAPYAILLGIISGFTEVIPVVGPILGAIPGLVLASFSPEGWVMVLKVLAVYVVVQQLENNLLVPKIQGDSVKLHPSLIMVSLVVGSQVAGLFGLIVAVPVAAILRDVYLYLYRRFAEGYSPHDAEASVPSRESEGTPEGETEESRELAEARKEPGTSDDEMIARLDETSAGGANSDEVKMEQREDSNMLPGRASKK